MSSGRWDSRGNNRVKVEATIKIDFETKRDVDPWPLIRQFTALSFRLGEYGCRNVRNEIIEITANGKSVPYPRGRL